MSRQNSTIWPFLTRDPVTSPPFTLDQQIIIYSHIFTFLLATGFIKTRIHSVTRICWFKFKCWLDIWKTGCVLPCQVDKPSWKNFFPPCLRNQNCSQILLCTVLGFSSTVLPSSDWLKRESSERLLVRLSNYENSHGLRRTADHGAAVNRIAFKNGDFI